LSHTAHQPEIALPGIVSGQYPFEESVGGPLSQMSEAVNNIDKIKTEDNVPGNGMAGNAKVS